MPGLAIPPTAALPGSRASPTVIVALAVAVLAPSPTIPAAIALPVTLLASAPAIPAASTTALVTVVRAPVIATAAVSSRPVAIVVLAG